MVAPSRVVAGRSLRFIPPSRPEALLLGHVPESRSQQHPLCLLIGLKSRNPAQPGDAPHVALQRPDCRPAVRPRPISSGGGSCPRRCARRCRIPQLPPCGDPLPSLIASLGLRPQNRGFTLSTGRVGPRTHRDSNPGLVRSPAEFITAFEGKKRIGGEALLLPQSSPRTPRGYAHRRTGVERCPARPQVRWSEARPRCNGHLRHFFRRAGSGN